MSTATWSGGNFSLGAGSVSDQHVASGAAIAASKLKHSYYPRTTFGAKIGDAPTTAEYIVHVANQTGVVNDFASSLNVVGSADMTVDLKKNGVSILTAPIHLTNALSNRQVLAGVLASNSFVAGDVISMAVTVTTSTGASGLSAWAGITEVGEP